MQIQPSSVLIVCGYAPRKEVKKFVPPPWEIDIVVDDKYESRRLFTPDLLREGKSFMWFVPGKARAQRIKAVEHVRKYGSEHDYSVLMLVPQDPELFERYRQKCTGPEGADFTWIVPSGHTSESHFIEYEKASPFPKGVPAWF